MHISYSDREYEKLRAFFDRSSCQSLCEYGRKVLLREPVNLFYRNESMDDMLEELVDLRMELKVVLVAFDEAFQHYQSGRSDPLTARIFESVVDEQLRPGIGKIMHFTEQIWNLWLQNSVAGKA